LGLGAGRQAAVVLPNSGGSLPNDVFSDTPRLPTLRVPCYPGCSQQDKAEFPLGDSITGFQSRARQGMVGVPAADNRSRSLRPAFWPSHPASNSLRNLADRNYVCARVMASDLVMLSERLVLCSEQPIAAQS